MMNPSSSNQGADRSRHDLSRAGQRRYGDWPDDGLPARHDEGRPHGGFHPAAVLSRVFGGGR